VLWDRWSEVAAYPVAIARAPSQHLASDHEAETLANGAAAPYPNLGPAHLPSPGAVLVQRLYAPGAATPDVVLAMVKPAVSAPPAPSADDDWEYLVLDPNGLITQRGALEACARCHAEAPHAGLFGRAR